MYNHGPSCLKGPVSRARDWWASLVNDDSGSSAVSASLQDLTAMDATIPNPTDDVPIRSDLVERIRREIDQGTYETPEKWEAALDRLLQRLTNE